MSPSTRRSEPRSVCFGGCHVVRATQACLLLYVVASIFSVLFGSKDLLTWLMVPALVVSLSIYAFWTERHKYLYPFLIITVIQQFVALIMALIIVCFSRINPEAFRSVIAHSLQLVEKPTDSQATAIVVGATAVCIIVALLHLWQAVIIYRCLEYYEEKAMLYGGSVSSRLQEETVGEWSKTAEGRGAV